MKTSSGAKHDIDASAPAPQIVDAKTSVAIATAQIGKIGAGPELDISGGNASAGNRSNKTNETGASGSGGAGAPGSGGWACLPAVAVMLMAIFAPYFAYAKKRG